MKCSVEGCDEAVLARGWCGRHYARWRRHGTTELRAAIHVVTCHGCGAEVQCAGKKPRKWCDRCKRERHLEEVRRWGPEWAAADPERARATKRKSSRRYRAAHPERVRADLRDWRARNAAHLRAYDKAYRARDPELYRRQKQDRNRKRAALIRGSRQGVIVRLGEIAEREGWKCHLCGGRVTRDDWSLDHLVPVSKGGPHTPENVALAHLGCNRRRSARDLAEWRERLASQTA